MRTSIEIRLGDRLPSERRIRVAFEITVDEEGTPVTARLLRSTGLRDLDDELMRVWLMRRFHPALLDGTAIPGWYRTDGQPARQ